MKKKHNYASRNRTAIYLEGSLVDNALAPYEEDLSAAGFDVHTHTGSKLLPELLRMTACDMLIVVAGGDNLRIGAKLGFALASGMQTVGVGMPSSSLFHIKVNSWDDLRRNQFLILGDGNTKKPAPAVKRRRDRRKI